MRPDQSYRQPIGILAALPEEIAGLLDLMSAPVSDADHASLGGMQRIEQWGQRDFSVGMLHGQPCVVALSRIGKVAAAATVTTLIHRFNIGAVIFSGVAGGVSSDIRVGDIVVATGCLQHDLDASPLFPRFEVPLLSRCSFDASSILSEGLALAVQAFIASLDEQRLAGSASASAGAGTAARLPCLHRGLIASRDRFISRTDELHALAQALPGLLAVDMESAAVAQVCYEHALPFAVVRSISDGADEQAATSFAQFLTERAGPYANGILSRYLQALSAAS